MSVFALVTASLIPSAPAEGVQRLVVPVMVSVPDALTVVWASPLQLAETPQQSTDELALPVTVTSLTEPVAVIVKVPTMVVVSICTSTESKDDMVAVLAFFTSSSSTSYLTSPEQTSGMIVNFSLPDPSASTEITLGMAASIAVLKTLTWSFSASSSAVLMSVSLDWSCLWKMGSGRARVDARSMV